MATTNISINHAWTQLATAAEEAVLISTKFPHPVQYATTAADVAPDLEGHTLANKDALSRSVIGSGYIWARVAPDVVLVSESVTLVVTK